MAKLIYSAIASLDGYIEDQDGNFDWAEPDEEVHAFINDLDQIWQAADKIVTLQRASTRRTRIERDFDPETVQLVKGSARSDLTVGGPDLAADAFTAGLVDECHLFVAPIVVGGGKRSLPDGVRLELELLEERRFGSGIVYLHYRVRT